MFSGSLPTFISAANQVCFRLSTLVRTFHVDYDRWAAVGCASSRHKNHIAAMRPSFTTQNHCLIAPLVYILQDDLHYSDHLLSKMMKGYIRRTIVCLFPKIYPSTPIPTHSLTLLHRIPHILSKLQTQPLSNYAVLSVNRFDPPHGPVALFPGLCSVPTIPRCRSFGWK